MSEITLLVTAGMRGMRHVVLKMMDKWGAQVEGKLDRCMPCCILSCFYCVLFTFLVTLLTLVIVLMFIPVFTRLGK